MSFSTTRSWGPSPLYAGGSLGIIHLVEGFEQALRLHSHQPGILVSLADYLHGRTGGYIVSLSHLIREAAIYAILTGAERIDKQVLESVELDYAAVEEAAETHRKAGQKTQSRKKR